MTDLNDARKQANADYSEHGKNMNKYPVNSQGWHGYEDQFKKINIYGVDDE